LIGGRSVVLTKSCLAFYRYDINEEYFKLIRSRYSFLDGRSLFLKSLTLANLDEDPAEEIIITGDDLVNQRIVDNRGWLLILKVRDDWLELDKAIRVNGNFAFQSLRTGCVTGNGTPEIISPLYRAANDMWNTFIVGWNAQRDQIIERKVFNTDSYRERIIHLDVGNVTPHPGEEIVIGHHTPDELRFYHWNGEALIEGPLYPLQYRRASITNIYVVDADQRQDSQGEVLVCGMGWGDERPSGQFYMEIFGYNDGFYSKWRKLGGEVGMIGASYAAINR